MGRPHTDSASLLRRLGLRSLRRPEALRQALTHSSAVAEENNERLEFLGDAVLKLAVSQWLYEQHPGYDEGLLSALRAYVVSDETLARTAEAIDLGEHLVMSSAEQRAGGRRKASMLACALEAVFGAVYLSEGLEPAAEVVTSLMSEALAAAEEKLQENYKDRLQVFTQDRYEGYLPVYEVVAEEGPPHNRVFHCTVKVHDLIAGHGRGRSKKAAEQEAARNALFALEHRTVQETRP